MIPFVAGDELREHSREEARRAVLYFAWVLVMASFLALALYQWKGLPQQAFVLLGGLSTASIGLVLIVPRLARSASLTLLSVQMLVAQVALAFIGLSIVEPFFLIDHWSPVV